MLSIPPPAALTSDELVFLQPVEYNSYFAGTCISWRRDANGGAWQPHYRITDHLGSTRLETSSNGTITAAYDYKPFGEQIPLMTTKTRKTYIGKERDDESYLGDFGVRKYDYAAGRFTSPDVLWEKYMGWSPYHYCKNNPISLLDDDGRKLKYPKDKAEATEFRRLIKELDKTPTGHKLVQLAESKNTPLITLKFGNVGGDTPDFNTTGFFEASGYVKSNKLISGTLTLEKGSKDIVPVLGHELKHFEQYFQNFNKWKKIGDEEKKLPHDSRQIEQAPMKTQETIKNEINP